MQPTSWAANAAMAVTTSVFGCIFELTTPTVFWTSQASLFLLAKWSKNSNPGLFLFPTRPNFSFTKVFDNGSEMFLDLYVDDGCTWDNDAQEADAFYERLAVAFSITHTDGGFYLGMDILQTDNRFITLTFSFPHPIS